MMAKDYEVNVTINGKDNTAGKFTDTDNMLSRWIENAAKAALGFISIQTAMKYLTVAIDFEHEMSAVQSVAMATTAQLEAMRSKAIQLGADTSFTASQAAQGMEELAKAGLAPKDVLEAIGPMLNLAAAGALSVADAARITATQLNAFGLEASATSHIADVLAKAAAMSATDVAGIGEASKYAAGYCSMAGLSFEDMAAAIALMSNRGIDASMAGTSLRNMITSLLNPTDEAKKVMDALGIKIFDATGNMIPFTEILRQFEPVVNAGASGIQAVNTVFGERGGPGMIALVKAGADNFDAFKTALENSGGAANEMAKVRLNNLAGAIEQLKGSVESLAIKFWKTEDDTSLGGAIKRAVEELTNFTNLASTPPKREASIIEYNLNLINQLGKSASLEILSNFVNQLSNLITMYREFENIISLKKPPIELGQLFDFEKGVPSSPIPIEDIFKIDWGGLPKAAGEAAVDAVNTVEQILNGPQGLPDKVVGALNAADKKVREEKPLKNVIYEAIDTGWLTMSPEAWAKARIEDPMMTGFEDALTGVNGIIDVKGPLIPLAFSPHTEAVKAQIAGLPSVMETNLNLMKQCIWNAGVGLEITRSMVNGWDDYMKYIPSIQQNVRFGMVSIGQTIETTLSQSFASFISTGKVDFEAGMKAIGDAGAKALGDALSAEVMKRIMAPAIASVTNALATAVSGGSAAEVVGAAGAGAGAAGTATAGMGLTGLAAAVVPLAIAAWTVAATYYAGGAAAELLSTPGIKEFAFSSFKSMFGFGGTQVQEPAYKLNTIPDMKNYGYLGDNATWWYGPYGYAKDNQELLAIYANEIDDRKTRRGFSESVAIQGAKDMFNSYAYLFANKMAYDYLLKNDPTGGNRMIKLSDLTATGYSMMDKANILYKFHQGGIIPFEGMFLGLRDEGVLNRSAMGRLGDEGLSRLNKGQPVGNTYIFNINAWDTKDMETAIRKKVIPQLKEMSEAGEVIIHENGIKHVA